jgi:hypothetical protein
VSCNLRGSVATPRTRRRTELSPRAECVRSISGLVVEYIVAIDVTRVRFPADAICCVFPADVLGNCHAPSKCDKDTLAEWLRRRPAKPMGSPRVGSNPTGVALCRAAAAAEAAAAW